MKEEMMEMKEENFGKIDMVMRVKQIDEEIEERKRIKVGIGEYMLKQRMKKENRVKKKLKEGMIGVKKFEIELKEKKLGGVRD